MTAITTRAWITPMSANSSNELRLVRVEPQPTYIEMSGRWDWPLPEHARREGCCTSVCTASREWWEYTPSEARPHPFAEGVCLRDDVWYWAIPADPHFAEAVELLKQYDGLMSAAEWDKRRIALLAALKETP
jgi:hypothetical protein